MLLTSCQSTKHYVPYPDFPVLETYERNAEDHTVTVPEEWIVELAEFQIKYETLKEVYNGQ